ncbi:MAG: ABC transporter permease [Bryobacterales bacterium]|nr:ABC transporter permease [Bryobacterales bacterium]
MRLSEMRSAAGMAFSTIREHKTRSLLTVLGVIIGTGCVIAVGSVITGVNGAVTNITNSMGPDTGFTYKFNLGLRGNISGDEFRRKPFTWDTAQALLARCPSVIHVSPYLFSPNMFNNFFERIKYKGKEVFQVELAGTTESYSAGNDQKMLFGRYFTDDESRRRQPVVVIGEAIYKGLMPDSDPVGKWVNVNGQEFEVVGVMAKPTASFPGQEDKRVLLPFFTMKKMFPNAKEMMIVFIAKPGMLPLAQDEVGVALRIERRVPPGKPDDFWISSGSQMLEDFQRITSMVALVMIVLSSIGLLVGGVGVMNIMLVSVTERTREIGIRKALGAKRSDIMFQFLTEAVVLTCLGGMLGMLVGWGISTAARFAFPSLPTSVPLWAAVLGVGVSVGVGLFFGLWPASRAAALDPVEALRHE